MFEARVIMPRLANGNHVPATTLGRWNAFLDSLERHEDWHVRYAYGQLPTVVAAIRKSSCERAADAAAAAIMRIAQVERDYDRRASTGHSDILPFP